MNKDGPLNPFAFGQLLVNPVDVINRIIELQLLKERSLELNKNAQKELCNQVTLLTTILEGYPEEIAQKVEKIIEKMREYYRLEPEGISSFNAIGLYTLEYDILDLLGYP